LLLLNEHSTGGTKGFRDFIGPSIDTGFRVSALASPRKLALTVDLAMMLAHTVINQPVDESFPLERIKFHYNGRVPLKGVLDGSPYPFFWVDTKPSDALYAVEDRILNTNPVDGSAVKEFCDLFILKQGVNMTRPFIQGSSDPLYKDIPEYHVARLQHLEHYWKNELKKRRSERDALSGNEPDAANTETLGEEKIEELAQMAITRTSTAGKPVANTETSDTSIEQGGKEHP
jgi:hypothetical protein